MKTKNYTNQTHMQPLENTYIATEQHTKLPSTI